MQFELFKVKMDDQHNVLMELNEEYLLATGLTEQEAVENLKESGVQEQLTEIVYTLINLIED